jgi:hypothetical protein
MNRPLLATAALALSLLVPAGCKPARTQLLVVLDTDLPECRLPDLRLRCGYDWNGQDERTDLTCLYEFHRGASMAEISLPGSFGVTPDELRPEQPITLVIDDNGAQALRRIVRVRPVAHETRLLTVMLHSACLETQPASTNHPCPGGRSSCTRSESCEAQGQTCGNGGSCRPLDIDPAELAPGDDASFDAGTRAPGDASACTDARRSDASASADAPRD